MAKKPTIMPRRPQARQPMNAAEIEKFVGAKEPKQAEHSVIEPVKLQAVPQPAPVEPTQPKVAGQDTTMAGLQDLAATKKKNVVKTRSRDGRTVRQTTVYLEPTLAKKLAHHCVDLEVDQSHIINEALKSYLATAVGP